jgi:DNA-binding GntR family transcriptional regulator
MPAKSRKQALREFLAAGEITAIGEEEWQAALRLLAPISESYLRDLLRQTGLPFAQPYAGIRQKSFADLEHDLREMLAVYVEAMRAGDRQRARYCRRQAIAAKDRARFAARSPKTSPEKRLQKDEMAQWMLVWLENPAVFPAWVEIRKRYCSSTAST